MQSIESENRNPHVIVIGGGLAGLTAALQLARRGLQVLLCERARRVGGRAVTRRQAGVLFNQGPHALYIGGGGTAVLADLDIPFQGGSPPLAGAAVRSGHKYILPSRPWDLIRTRLFTGAEKLQLARALAALMRADADSLGTTTVAAWVQSATSSPRVQEFMHALVRLSTYAHAPQLLSAAVFARQMQLVLRHNVCYLDGGWQTLVGGLQRSAGEAGVQFLTGTRVTAIEETATAVQVQLADGRSFSADGALLAVDPVAAAAMLPTNRDLQRWAAQALPVHAACLDVALRRLPCPEAHIALGIDQPLYYSHHSHVADLGAGGAVIHLVKYCALEEDGDHDNRVQLAGLLDLMQPGWRREVVTQRYLPRMVVVNALATVMNDGLRGRPGYALPQSRRLYLAGDWVGPHGWLADASLVSGQRAAQMLAAALTALHENKVAVTV